MSDKDEVLSYDGWSLGDAQSDSDGREGPRWNAPRRLTLVNREPVFGEPGDD